MYRFANVRHIFLGSLRLVGVLKLPIGFWLKSAACLCSQTLDLLTTFHCFFCKTHIWRHNYLHKTISVRDTSIISYVHCALLALCLFFNRFIIPILYLVTSYIYCMLYISTVDVRLMWYSLRLTLYALPQKYSSSYAVCPHSVLFLGVLLVEADHYFLATVIFFPTNSRGNLLYDFSKTKYNIFS